VARAGAVLLPLTFSWVTFDQFVLPRVALARLLVACLLALWLGQALHTGRLSFRRTPLDVPLLAVTASAALSTLLAVNRDVAVFGVYLRDEGLLTICTYALLFWLVAQSLTGRDDVRALVWCLLASAYVVALAATFQSLLAGRLAGGVETAQTFGGWVRASGTFGNPILLGTYLAMVLPLAVEEAVAPGSAVRRALAANVVAVVVVALLLTFSRAAWLGAGAGVALALAPRLRRSAAGRRAALGAVLAVLALAAAGAAGAGPPVLATALARAASLATPFQGSGGTRLAIWRDTPGLVAARPLVGWGPDTFGLVYPAFRTGPGPAGVVDKAHSDLLQVAATQGLIGAAASMWVLVALAAAFWRGRRAPGAFALLGAVVAYELNVQVEFAWVPMTAPFWIVAASATAAWAEPAPTAAGIVAVPLGRFGRVPVGVACLLPLAIVALLAGRPFLADACSLQGLLAQGRGETPAARAWLGRARLLAPEEATYAAEVGDLALDVRPDGRPGPGADWASARTAYLDAVRLGTEQPVVYDRLAMADRELGRLAEADEAARTARRLSGGA